MEKPDTVQHYEELLASGSAIYLDPIELDEIFHFYAEANQLDEVEKVLTLALQLHPDDMLVQQMDAEYTLNTGDAAGALEKLDKFFSPDSPFQCILRSAAFAKLNKRAEALNMAEQALIEEDPKEFVAYDLGLGFMNADDCATAMHYFKRSLKNHPDDTRTMVGLLFCLNRLNKIDQAQDLADQILALDPFNYDAWMAKGNYYGIKGEYEKALEAYDYALAVFPSDVDALIFKARCLDGLKRNKEALDIILEATEQAEGEQRSAICIIAAGLLNEQRRQKEAIDMVWNSLAGTEGSTMAIVRAAYAMDDINAKDEAIELFQAALELQPDNPEFIRTLAELYGNTNQHNKAEECYKILSKIEPNASVYALWAGSLMSQSKFAKAYPLLKKANDYEEIWQTYILMAACDIELKHPKRMEENLRLAYALCPDEAWGLFEKLCLEDAPRLKEEGLLDRLEKRREEALLKREEELRILAEAREEEKRKRKRNK